MKHDKDPPRSYCLAAAFLWTETSLHSETFKFINVGQTPHVNEHVKNTCEEQMNSHLLSREELPFAITAAIQIPDYIYTWRFELEQGSSSQTQSIFWKYTEQKIACILQCKNSATKSFIADQETVSRD